MPSLPRVRKSRLARIVFDARTRPVLLSRWWAPWSVVTVTFEERDGRTHLVSQELYPSKEALDAEVASGMERGVRATMDPLEELVLSHR